MSPISNASRLADFGSGIGTAGAIIQVDNTNQRVGIGTTNPQAMLQVGTAISMFGSTGIVSATAFYGDGANLSNVISGVELKSAGSSVGSAITTINFASGATITNWIQPSDTYSSPGRIGSSMSESSGIWTFPQTGIYNVTATFTIIVGTSDDGLAQVRMYVTDNGGTNYHNVALWRAGSHDNAIHHTVTNNYVIEKLIQY